MNLSREAFEAALREAIRSPKFVRASFGGPRRNDNPSPWLRATVRAIEVNGVRTIQIEKFSQRQSFASNVAEGLQELLGLQFSAIHVTTMEEEIDLQTSKKGKHFITRQAARTVAVPLEHNRRKSQPLPEGEPSRLLEVMGIADAAGRVKPTMRGKFTQINEFLKQFLHVKDDAGLANLGRPLEILDCGCGSSFLTLALHHYLNDKLGLPANLLGVDVNDHVIRKSAERAERLGAESLKFVCEKIDSITVKPDVVVALHACDTATDAALVAAIKAEAKLILSVPCCHHDLNSQLNAASCEPLRPILRHGILHERQADLITDAFRALILRLHGYRAEIVEFISSEHTARNLMIRAVRTGNGFEKKFEDEYRAMKAFFGVTPYLETLLVR